WNDTARNYDDNVPMVLPQLLERQAFATPEAVAVRFLDEVLTYRELDAAANQLAHALRELGAGPGTILAIHMQRSVDMVVALLATLKSGAAYLPLDVDYPAERLRYMLDSRRADLCLV